MKALMAYLLVAFIALESFGYSENSYLLDPTVRMVTEEKPFMGDAERIGVNLSAWTTWGAEQISNNFLMNPGFEGAIDRVVVIVTRTDGTNFYDEENWGYDDGHWDGAEFAVRTGKYAGHKGIIGHSVRKGLHGLPQYTVEGDIPTLAPKDVIVLTKTFNLDKETLWWVQEGSKERITIDPDDRRPGSPGKQSLQLTTKRGASTEIDYYLDAISDRAGKLLDVNGKWKISFWAKSDNPDLKLKIVFQRLNGTEAFLFQELHPSMEWKEYVFDFHPKDIGPPQTLKLAIVAQGSREGRIWLDDMYLGHADGEQEGLRASIVQDMKKLRPSFIRDWQGQLGDTFDNRIAGIYERRSVSKRAFAGTREVSMMYSLPDFLKLCQEVGANPWIIVPTTFSDEEAFKFGQFLAAHASKEVFSEVILEFGNENWNWLFRATGFPYPDVHGLVAERVFQQVKEGMAGKVTAKFAVNGQHVNPTAALLYLKSTPLADILAVAPYIFYSLNSNAPAVETLQTMLKDDMGFLKQIAKGVSEQKKQLAVYEFNLHTTQGNAPEYERDTYTAGMGAGVAVAKGLIEAIQLKIQPQSLFTFLQYDADLWDIREKTKLWGILRDLGVTDRFRPQGLAMMMLNRVIGGNVHQVNPVAGEDINTNEAATKLTMVAFNQGDLWTAAVVNGNEMPVHVVWTLPGNTHIPLLHQLVLDAKSPFDTNEIEEQVRVMKKVADVQGNEVRFTVPSWGFVVIGGDVEEI